MSRTICYGNFYVYKRISPSHSSCSGLSDSFFARPYKLPRNLSTFNVINESHRFLTLKWFQSNPHMSKLAVTTCLLNKFAFNLNLFTYCFSVRYLWSPYIGIYFVFTQHPIFNYFQMQLTHTRDNHLSSLFIQVNFECRVFFCQF